MKGFTLIEALVGIAIIGILSAVLLANYRSGSDTLDQQRGIQMIAQALRSAQNKALGAEEVSCPTPPCQYYGVHFDKASREIKVFVSNDKVYSTGEELSLETRTLEGDVFITDLSPGTNMLDITFLPPDPKVFFSPPGTSSTITITGGRGVNVLDTGNININ